MTRSEMALPLRLGRRVMGALDVQSTQANAFSEEDVATLSILADQVAIAIENARLFSESQAALVDSQDTFDKYVKQEWSSFARQVRQTGFVYDGKRVMALDANRQPEQKRNIVQTGRLSLEKVSPTIAIPIKLRGQTIGMLDVRSKTGQREWTQDEVTLLEAAAERAALALENARLVESAQRRAARERAIGEISSKIGTYGDMNSILQSAVEELGRRIGGATEVTIELGDDDMKANS
jgi:GAF domain-containing protein